MTQVLTLVALLALLSFGQTAPPPPDMEPQGPSLNGSPSQALGPSVRFVVEGVELPDGSSLSR